jgi:hypothetical protein
MLNAIVTYVIICTYAMGPSWHIVPHGLKSAEKRVLMNIFFGVAHSQVWTKTRRLPGRILY